jgi:hypothetical protein
MVQQAAGKFAYILDTITQNAPVMSGVYTLYSRGVCLYVGESDDICASLLQHYYEDNPSLNDKEITHFTFDLVPPEARRGLLLDRTRQLGPTCNQRTGSSVDYRCQPAQELSPYTPLEMAGMARS